MIEHTLDATNAILHIRPKSSLEQADFEQLAKAVDPFIAGTGDLAGLIIETPAFPGWSSFGAFAAHMRFDPIELLLQAFRRVTGDAEHTHAARLRDCRNDIAAMRKREQRKLYA